MSILFRMAMKAATRFSVKTDTSVFKRLGRGNQDNIPRNHQRLYQENISIVKPTVCKYWLNGRCTRNPCIFLHPHQAKLDITKSKSTWKNRNTFKSENSPPIQKTQRENCDHNQIVQQNLLTTEVNDAQSKSIKKIENCTKVEKSVGQSKSIEKTENCTKGKQSENMQSWFCGNGLSVLAQLEGNTKVNTWQIFFFCFERSRYR